MLHIIGNGTHREVYKNQSLSGISVNIYLYASANNTNLYSSDVDFQAINVKAMLKRNGKTIDILNGNLEALVSALCYKSVGFVQLADTSTNNILRAKDTSVKEIQVIPFNLTFGYLKLQGNDELHIEVSANNHFSADIDTTLSYIDVVADSENSDISDAGIVPQIEVISIQQNIPNGQWDLGNDVETVVFVNLDKSGILSANQVLTNCTISSKQISESFDVLTLLARRNQYFETSAEASARNQSFIIETNVDMDSCKLDAQFTSANVTSGMNYWVVRRLIQA